MDEQKKLREHLSELLEGRTAHIGIEAALRDFPTGGINEHVANSPHTAWQLLEHIRIAQGDILDFSTNPNYKEINWPDDYWPKSEGAAESWKQSVKQVLDDLQTMRDLVADETTDLFVRIPHGEGQTILREALLVADHNAYHLGQLVLIGKMIETQ